MQDATTLGACSPETTIHANRGDIHEILGKYTPYLHRIYVE